MEAINDLHRRVEELAKVCYSIKMFQELNDESTERE